MGPNQYAMCRCGSPLISTFLFYKKEFICLDCGSLYEFLQPRGKEATPELDAQYESLHAEWKEIMKGALCIGATLPDCELCKTSGDYSHLDHATDEEKAASEAAFAKLNERTGKEIHA